MNLFWQQRPYQHQYIDLGLVADVHVTDQGHEESEITFYIEILLKTEITS